MSLRCRLQLQVTKFLTKNLLTPFFQFPENSKYQKRMLKCALRVCGVGWELLSEICVAYYDNCLT